MPAFGFNRSPSGAKDAAEEGFEASADLKETLARAEAEQALIVLATPMPAIRYLLDEIKESAPSCGITDVVSVKAEVYRLVKERGLEDRYVGGHPMAGTSDSGWAASSADLFQGASWVVTFDHAEEQGEDNISDSWCELWMDVVKIALLVGAEIVPSRVDAHDAAVARISHLPHILAETLAIVGDHGGALALSLAAGSFRDGTRVAGTAPSLVRAMCETNNEALADALDEALKLLKDARAHLESPTPNLQELADAGYRSRIRYEARAGLNSPLPGPQRPVLRLHPGAPGWLSQLNQAESLGARIDVF